MSEGAPLSGLTGDDLLAFAGALALPAPVVGPSAWLSPTELCDAAHPLVVARARAVAGEGSAAERAARLFAHVRDEVRYDLAPTLVARDSWRASDTLARGTGFCQQKAVALVALCRAAGIPAAIAFQHIRDHKLLTPRFSRFIPGGIIIFHGLVALGLGGRILRVDPSLDATLCQARGYRLVELAAIPEAGEALLPRTDLAGQPHFDFLGEAGPFAEVPVEVTDLLISVGELWDGLRELARRGGASM